MTQTTLFPIATSSQQDTPVSPSPKRVAVKERKMTATSGRTSLKLLHPKDPLGLFSKTFMVTSAWGSTKCSLTWKPKATPQGRLLFQLAPSALPTEGTESGLWATPRTTDVTGGPRQLDEKGRRISKTNPDLKFGANLADQVRMWPTPTTRDYKGGYQGGRIRNGKVSMDTLDVAVQHTDNQSKTGGQLNPMWVEWLMGYPKGWTDLKD
tara:strand:- start:2 stop:628 length:627 start_codon:yes stop_codon:yes gene_type:complete